MFYQNPTLELNSTMQKNILVLISMNFEVTIYLIYSAFFKYLKNKIDVI